MFYFHGAKDTRKNSGKPYDTFTFDALCKRASNPQNREKNRAVAMIFSDHNGQFARNASEQIKYGYFNAIAADIDVGTHSIEEVDCAAVGVFGDVQRLIYSSSSATEKKPKWRFIVPIKRKISGAIYSNAQEVVIALMADCGITLDPKLKTPSQPIYAPNVPPEKRDAEGRPLFYQHAVRGSQLLESVESISGFCEKRLKLAAEKFRSDEAAKATACRKAKLRHQQYQMTGLVTPVEHFNANHNIEEMLLKYGWVKLGSGYASPNSTSKGKSVYVVGQRAFSFTGSDKGILGHQGPSCVTYDAFDVYAYGEHQGDLKAAAKTYAEEAGLNQQIFKAFLQEFKQTWI